MKAVDKNSHTSRLIGCLVILMVGAIGVRAAARSANQWLTYPPHEPQAGEGLPSCALFISAAGENPIGKGLAFQQGGEHFVNEAVVYSSWAEGFITGINLSQASPNKQIDTDFAAIDLWLRNYCFNNPTKSFLEAVSTFSNQNMKAR